MDQRERELRSTRGRGRRCDRGEVLQVLGGFGEGIQVRLGADMSRFASGPFPSSWRRKRRRTTPRSPSLLLSRRLRPSELGQRKIQTEREFYLACLPLKVWRR